MLTDSLINGIHDRHYAIIERAYEEHSKSILRYIGYRINNPSSAEDLLHDVFIRSLESKTMIREQSARALLYSIARNIVIDYLRRHGKLKKINDYFYDHAPRSANSTDEIVSAREISKIEMKHVGLLSVQRRRVYLMDRLHGESIDGISQKLSLSKSTVENHLLAARRTVREEVRKYIY